MNPNDINEIVRHVIASVTETVKHIIDQVLHQFSGSAGATVKDLLTNGSSQTSSELGSSEMTGDSGSTFSGK